MKKKLEEKLDEIVKITQQVYHNEEHIGVLHGISGIALFLFYYARYLNTNTLTETATNILEEALEKINQGYGHSTFCTGISGMGWVLGHLDEQGFIDVDNDGLLWEIDDFLYSIMISNASEKNFDYLHGGIGHALYFLSRFKNTKSPVLKEKYKGFLLEFVTLLKEKAQKDGANLKWTSTGTRDGNGRTYYDFSLSHGMAAVIGILTKLHEHDDFKVVVEPILVKAINYVLQYRQEKSFFLFPNLVFENGEENVPSRLAWCYGDLGIGIRLWFASKALDDEVLAKEALTILKHSAKRRTYDETKIMDAGLCHGSFGVALIFMRVYKETGDYIFKEAVEYWMEDGVNKANHNNGYAGYKQWKYDDIWDKEVSLLEGVSGIGLAIITYLSDVDISWDECLMIS
nr:lanthionine synthetase C family protein [Allomuricauda sp.]